MCKDPNEGKITTFLQQCLTPLSAKADLSASYSSSDLSVEQVEFEDMCTYHICAQCSLPHGACPYCGSVSHSVHSRYRRTITDLSILGHPAVITFEARKFFCHNPNYRRKTFAEQPGNEVFRYRRRTRRCEMAVIQHGLECSSESSRKLLSATGVSVSGDTVLRAIHRMSVPERCEVQEIGVDDWAFRKGATYGSIIVSLETVSVRLVMFNEVKELQADGLNVAQISRKLDIARQTVRKYMAWNTLPKMASKERLPYYLYDTYVEEEYRHGKDLRKIFLEIKEEGFPGSLTPFYDHYRYLSDGHRGYRPRHEVEKMKKAPAADREPLLPIRQIANIMDKSIRKKMAQDETALVEKMMSFGWFRDIYNAASSFYTTIMGDSIDELEHGLKTTEILQCKSFDHLLMVSKWI